MWDGTTPRKRTLNKALWRPETVAGCEKMPLGVVVTAAVMFAMFAWMMASIVALVVALFLVLVGIPVLRRIGQADPRMFAVYRANMKYRVFYPARTSVFTKGR